MNHLSSRVQAALQRSNTSALYQPAHSARHLHSAESQTLSSPRTRFVKRQSPDCEMSKLRQARRATKLTIRRATSRGHEPNPLEVAGAIRQRKSGESVCLTFRPPRTQGKSPLERLSGGSSG
jgi:hypothetical protein